MEKKKTTKRGDFFVVSERRAVRGLCQKTNRSVQNLELVR